MVLVLVLILPVVILACDREKVRIWSAISVKSMIRLRFAFLFGHALRFCCVDRDRDIMFASAICVFMVLLVCEFGVGYASECPRGW